MGHKLVRLFILFSCINELPPTINCQKKTPLKAGLGVTPYVTWRIQEQNLVFALCQLDSSKCLDRLLP